MPGKACLTLAAVAVLALALSPTGAHAARSQTHGAAACGCGSGRKPPPPPRQAVTDCATVRFPRSRAVVEVFRGYYTTPCRTARRVVSTFWSRHGQRRGALGGWRCVRYPYWHTVQCHGPKRQWASGSRTQNS